MNDKAQQLLYLKEDTISFFYTLPNCSVGGNRSHAYLLGQSGILSKDLFTCCTTERPTTNSPHSRSEAKEEANKQIRCHKHFSSVPQFHILIVFNNIA